jgi:peptidyl-prolyl cis-trans isomerase C
LGGAGRLRRAFGKALATLTPGTYTQTPVQTQFGYHIIQLDEVRDLKAPSFEETKPQIIQRLQAQGVDQHIQELAKAAKIN